MINYRSAAALVVTLATTALANPSASPQAPVAGGLSDRLAPLGSFLESQPTDFRANLAGQLDQARTQTHELIDKIVDEGGLPDFLEAMSQEGGEESALAKQLASTDAEQARAVLHSRVERQLASFGRTIQKGLTQEDPSRLKASFDLAMRDLAREENHLMKSLDAEGPAAPVSSDLELNHEELDEPPSTEGPAAPQAMGPAAPEGQGYRQGNGRGNGRGRGGHPGMRNGGGPGGNRGFHRQGGYRGGHGAPPVMRQVHHTQRQVQHTRRQVRRTQHQLHHTQRQLAYTQNQMHQMQRNQMYQQRRRDMRRHRRHMHHQMDRMRRERRAYRQVHRSAWLTAQAQAAAWNARCQGYSTYAYRPGYQRRYSRPFPSGYYYRPDRVERVVQRGLWGVATVAATPFALLASVF
jgi:hypothetical protein